MLKTRSSAIIHTMKRTLAGKFVKQYSCINHDNFAEQYPSNGQLLNIHSGKKVKKCVVDYLISSELLTKRSKFICKSCIMHGQSKLNIEENNSSILRSGLEIGMAPSSLLARYCSDHDDYSQGLTMPELSPIVSEEQSVDTVRHSSSA